MSTLETRSEIQLRVSKPTGQSKEDREDHIAYLLVQLQKDTEVVIESMKHSIDALTQLKGISEIRGTKARIRELHQSIRALRLVRQGCVQVLNLTNNKSYTVDAERRFTTLEKRDIKRDTKRAMGREKINQVSLPVNSSENKTPLKELMTVISRREEVTANIHLKKDPTAKTITSTEAKPSLPKRIVTPRRKKAENPVATSDYRERIILKDKTEVYLDSPKFDKEKVCYTVRELMLLLRPYDGDGVKRIVGNIYERGRCLISPSAFQRRFKKYLEQGILPPEDYYGDTIGRPKSIETEEIPLLMNKAEHSNLSYVGQGLEESYNVLSKARKRKAQSEGVCPQALEDASSYTVSCHDRFATLFDPQIAKVSSQSTRIKSENREIMSRSPRAFVASASAAINTSFCKGKWATKKLVENELPEGALLAHSIAENVNGGVHMEPIQLRQIVNGDDIGRFVTEGIKFTTSLFQKKRQKAGKTSKNATKREIQKVSSLWRKATEDDNYCHGIKVKFKSLIAASGHVGPIVMHFYGLTDADITVDFLVYEVPGLCIGGDIIPGRLDIGYVILSKGKGGDELGGSEVTVTERVMKWYHETIVLPFIDSLRKMGEDDEAYIAESNLHRSGASFDWTVFEMDSEISYLNYLRRPETIELNKINRVLIKKICAAGTESYQALDCGNCFLELASKLERLTAKYSLSVLKNTLQRMLDEDEQFIMKNKTKLAAMVDAVAVAPEVYKFAFTKSKIQQSFVTVGEITNYGSMQNPKFVACPNLLEMRKNCKFTWTKDFWDFVLSTLPLAVQEMRTNGYIKEEWFDLHNFPKDTKIDGTTVTRDYSLKQLHMHRHLLLSNKEIVTYFQDLQEESRLKKQASLDLKYHVAWKLLALNTEATIELRRVHHGKGEKLC